MSQSVISVEGLSKYYKLGVIGGATLREDMSRWLAKLQGKPDPTLPIGSEQDTMRKRGEIWALRDINFEVKEGEILGIIGRNGAGKSTLLKILSRITAPTAGRAVIRGRVGSLLEVGTGFHPELTGRENIYLNGAILGMSKAEVSRKLEEIVSFAEMTKFLDTPVKRYSSGMIVRLAFAVAAHLEPEILIVDEVLAVGDTAFQKKCLGKMEDVAGSGRTVLFVSHNMGMITSLCTRAVLLDGGEVVTEDETSAVVSLYYRQGDSTPFAIDFSLSNRNIGDEMATLISAHLENAKGKPTGEFDIREPVSIYMRYKLHQSVPVAPYANFHFYDERGNCVFVSAGNSYNECNGAESGIYVAKCEIPGNFLNNSTYFISLALTFTHKGLHVSFFEKDALSLTVIDSMDGTMGDLRCGYRGPIPGVLRPKLRWMIRKET